MGLLQSIVDLFDRSLSLPVNLQSDSGDSLDTNEIGRKGESLACLFLRRQGKKILYRNFDPPYGGEVDIVYRDGDTLVFGEVKTRTSEDFGRPLDAVDKDKEERVAKGGLAWMRMLDAPVSSFRFDVIEVVLIQGELPAINLIEEAFHLPDGYLPPQ